MKKAQKENKKSLNKYQMYSSENLSLLKCKHPQLLCDFVLYFFNAYSVEGKNIFCHAKSV